MQYKVVTLGDQTYKIRRSDQGFLLVFVQNEDHWEYVCDSHEESRIFERLAMEYLGLTESRSEISDSKGLYSTR